MRIGLIIADFESSYATSFQYTARVKYEVDFDTSNVDSLGDKLVELKHKVENKLHRDVHVGFEITIEHVEHVQDLLQKILNRYIEVYGKLPVNKKNYTINQKLREAETPTSSEIATEVLTQILTPKKENLSRKDKVKIDAEAKSKQRALDLMIKKNKI